jgi:excinuclease UvrABC nuclease subunit
MLSKDNLKKIPHEPGVYELSILSKIDYPNHRSNVIYIGTSQNLRKRIANYSGNNLKNDRLKNFINNYDVSVRFYLTENHVLVEKKLLRSFKNTYGQLPKANSLGG